MKHRATVILVAIVLASAAPRAQDSERLFKAAMNTELVEGDLRSAIEQYRKVAQRAPRPLAAQALVRMAECYQKLGDAQAAAIYQRVVREYADQADSVTVARTRLAAVASSGSRDSPVTLRSVPRSDGLAGTVSADGRYMSYTSWVDGELYVRDLQAGTERALTARGDFSIGLSVISRQGVAAAYQSYQKGCDGKDPVVGPALCLVPSGGTGLQPPRVLVGSPEIREIVPLDWSPDGSKLAVTLRRQDRTAQIGLVSTADGSLRVLQSVDWRGPTRIVFSPDGQYVAFDLPVSDSSDERDLFLMAIDGSRRLTAVEHPSQDVVMAWTPDGSALLFASDRGGTLGLWAQALVDRRPVGAPRLMRTSLPGAWSVGLTRNGALYFGVTNSERDISMTTIDLVAGTQLASPARAIRRFVGTNSMPEWSSDGKLLAYVSQRGFSPSNNGGRIIGIRDMSSGEERELRPRLTYFGPLSWSSDGAAFVTSGTDLLGRSGVFSIDARSGAVSLIVEDSFNAYPQWSPDGKHVFYRKSVPGDISQWSLVDRELASGTERTLASGEVGLFSVSPDGRSIAASMGGILVAAATAFVEIRVDTGATRDLMRASSTERFPPYVPPQWTPDGRAVLVRKRTPNELWYVPIDGAPPRKLDVDVREWLFGAVGQFAVNPDGRRVAFLSGNISNEVMVLENFLPERRARLDAQRTQPATRGDRAVWTGPKVDLFGRVSPDERFISYTDWTTAGYSNLSLHDLRTHTDRFLTGNKSWFNEEPKDADWGEAQWSAVSPDGQQVAYAWFNQNVSEVRVVPVAEGPIRQPRTLLKFTDAAPGVRDWSPDGKLLAIGTERSDKSTQIVIATVADGSMRVLKTMSWRGAQQLFFSRDSRFLAFDLPASDDDNVQQRDVFIIAVDGSREVRAIADAADDRVAGWSPDGKYLLFSSTRTGARSLWALRVADGRPQGRPELVKTDIGSSFSLGVGNSGALYLHKTVSSRDVKIAPIDLNAGTVGQTRHFSQGLLPRPFTPHWSPDGKFLAYQVRGDEEGLAIRSVETGEVRRLRNIQYVPEPRWSPDGRSLIAGMEDSKGRMGIYRIDAQSGDSTFIVATDSLAFPRWSADGTKIYYINRRPFQTDERQIRERDLRTGVERDLFSHRLLNSFEVSLDGRSLAVPTLPDPASQTTSLWIVPIAEGRPRELARIPISESVTNTRPAIAWTPDSRALLTARRSGAATELWLVDVDSGRGRKLNTDVGEWTLGQGDGPIGGFSLSPDGRSIAFLMGKSGAEVWALENFLTTLK